MNTDELHGRRTLVL